MQFFSRFPSKRVWKNTLSFSTSLPTEATKRNEGGVSAVKGSFGSSSLSRILDSIPKPAAASKLKVIQTISEVCMKELGRKWKRKWKSENPWMIYYALIDHVGPKANEGPTKGLCHFCQCLRLSWYLPLSTALMLKDSTNSAPGYSYPAHRKVQQVFCYMSETLWNHLRQGMLREAYRIPHGIILHLWTYEIASVHNLNKAFSFDEMQAPRCGFSPCQLCLDDASPRWNEPLPLPMLVQWAHQEWQSRKSSLQVQHLPWIHPTYPEFPLSPSMGLSPEKGSAILPLGKWGKIQVKLQQCKVIFRVEKAE